MIGFCLGGGFALLCAPRGQYAAASVNYGEVPSDAETVLAGSCPIVASYGGRDPMGTAAPKRLEAALTELGVPHDVKVYPAAGHSFMSPKPASLAPLVALARLNYDKEAAEEAWQRIFAFFGTHLGSRCRRTRRSGWPCPWPGFPRPPGWFSGFLGFSGPGRSG